MPGARTEGQAERVPKGSQKLLGEMRKFTIFIELMVSRVFTSVKT